MEIYGSHNLLAIFNLKSATFDTSIAFESSIVQLMKQTTTQFDFSAKPKVTAVKPKYREDVRLDGTNLMNDPRVVRGNTYAAIVENKNDVQPPPRKAAKEQPRKQERRINFDTGFEVSTPRALDGREHFTVQTEPFVETLRDKPIQYEKECQSDLFLDRPVEREFDPMKGKTGVDRTTQIEENDPELFDFNYEVQPIVDALLSKVIETSRMELYEEKQLRQKEKEKQQYEQKRHARLAEAQKLEANETRQKEEYDRRQLQYRKSNEQECAAQKKIIGRILSKQYLKHLKDNTYKILDTEGFFRSPLQTDLYATFTPWLYQEIINQLHTREEFSRTSETVLTQAEKDILKESEGFVKAERDRRNKLIAEREEEKRLKEERRQEKKRLKEQAQKAKLEEQAQAQEVPAS